MQLTPTQFLESLLKAVADLPPTQIVTTEAALAPGRRRVEAIVEIGTVGLGRGQSALRQREVDLLGLDAHRSAALAVQGR